MVVVVVLVCGLRLKVGPDYPIIHLYPFVLGACVRVYVGGFVC